MVPHRRPQAVPPPPLSLSLSFCSISAAASGVPLSQIRRHLRSKIKREPASLLLSIPPSSPACCSPSPSHLSRGWSFSLALVLGISVPPSFLSGAQRRRCSFIASGQVYHAVTPFSSPLMPFSRRCCHSTPTARDLPAAPIFLPSLSQRRCALDPSSPIPADDQLQSAIASNLSFSILPSSHRCLPFATPLLSPPNSRCPPSVIFLSLSLSAAALQPPIHRCAASLKNQRCPSRAVVFAVKTCCPSLLTDVKS